ncbi:MAG: hypothetical protein CMJ76_12625 [Planctomycetaceae bacterium]|nr:hypothetical protein [Planctomycetaceae bacterium]|tara:strand:+ start:714 stop:1529 length:816 start_codon:yes stop_codon:yes gene_type:complete
MNADANAQQRPGDPDIAERIKDEVRIYFYPKVVFLLPTLVFCFLAACYLQFVASDSMDSAADQTTQQVVEANAADNELPAGESVKSAEVTVTVIFMMIFMLNLVVMGFDFPSNRFIALIAFVFLGIAILWILSKENPDLLGGIGDFISSFEPSANATFYWVLTLMLSCLFLIILFARALDYWEIRPNEAVHVYGLPRHKKRYSAHHMRFEMEVNDIFEHMWPFKAGRIYIRPTNEKHQYVLDNVMNVRKVNDQANQILSALQVQVREDAEV